ncbi:hypothetical protein KCU90_g231, partial [Aureobasidium melanogenum]
MRCSLTNTLADLTFFLTHPLTLHKTLSFHFGSLSNFVLLAMMIVVPLDCAEIPLLVVFTVIVGDSNSRACCIGVHFFSAASPIPRTCRIKEITIAELTIGDHSGLTFLGFTTFLMLGKLSKRLELDEQVHLSSSFQQYFNFW